MNVLTVVFHFMHYDSFESYLKMCHYDVLGKLKFIKQILFGFIYDFIC